MSTPLPNIPAISTKATPAEIKRAFDSLRAYFAQMQTVNASTQRRGGGSGGSGGDGGLPGDDGGSVPDMTIPPAITGFAATGAFNSIILEWDTPRYSNHAYTEIHRAETDNLGIAVFIGTTPAALYADVPPDSRLSVTYYYWARNVSTSGIKGPFQAANGAEAHTADEPGYLLELLTGEITSGQLFIGLSSRIDLIDAPVTGLVTALNDAKNLLNDTRNQLDDTNLWLDGLVAQVAGAMYVQGTAPIPGVAGVMNPIPEYAKWYDSSNGNHPYIWIDSGSGFSWHDLSDGRLGQNAAEITQLDSRLDTAESGISGHATALSVLDTTVVSHGNTLASHSSSLLQLDADLTTAEGAITGNASSISSLSSRVTSTEGSITSQASSITSLNASVGQKARVFKQNEAPWTSFYPSPGNPSVTAITKAVSGTVFTPDNQPATLYVPTTVYTIHQVTASGAVNPQIAVGETKTVQLSLYIKEGAATYQPYFVVCAKNATNGVVSYGPLMTYNTTTKITALPAPVNGWSAPSAQVIDVGGGWNKVTLTATYTQQGTATQLSGNFQIKNGTGAQTYAGDGVTGVYLDGPAFFVGETADTIGDLWFDSDDNNRVYRWNGSAWIESTDTRTAANSSAVSALDSRVIAAEGSIIAQAASIVSLDSRLDDAEGDIGGNASALTSLNSRVTSAEGSITSQATSITSLTTSVGQKARVFPQDTAPTATAVNDLWIETDNGNKLWRWSGSAWTSAQDGSKNRTFYQAAAPTATATGDVWFDSDDNNRQYRWNGSSWGEVTDTRTGANSSAISALDSRVTTAEGNITAQASLITELDSRLDDAEGDIGGQATTLSALNSRVTSAEGSITSQASSITSLTTSVGQKARVFPQDTAPTATAVNDLWIETDNGNKLWRWSGSAWTSAQDSSKNRTFFQAAAPTATATGDVWFDSDASNRQYRWNGSAWTEVTDTRTGANSSAISALDSRVLTAEGNITAQASSITQLDSRLDAAEGDIGGSATALNTLTTNVTTVQANATNDDAVSLGFNPNFSLWSSTFPDGWVNHIGGTIGLVKEETIKRIGQYSVRYNCSTDTGRSMRYTAQFDTAPLPVDTLITGSVDIWINSVAPENTTGKPGLRISVFRAPALGSQTNFDIVADIAKIGSWQRIPFTLRVPAGSQIYGIRAILYAAVNSMTAYGSANFRGEVIFDNLRFSLVDSSMDAQERAAAAQVAATAVAAAAQSTANTAVTNAATAQTAANTANGLLADIASNDKLTASEKQQTKVEWDGIVTEKAGIDAQADIYAITTEKTAYGTAYTTLSSYITPLLASLTTTSDIVGSTFMTNFSTYYSARQALLDKIAVQAKADALSTSFASHLDWRFRNTASNWTVAAAGSLTLQPNAIRVTNVTGNGNFMSPVISVIGAQQTKVRARIRHIAGGGLWRGRLYWKRSGHGYTSSYYKDVPNTNILTSWHIVEWDLTNPTIGGTDWIDNTITGIRLDLTTGGVGEVWEVDWIAIGEHGFNSVSETAIADMLSITTASATSVSQLQARLDTGDYAAVKAESAASVNSIGEINAKYTVKIDVNGYVCGYGLIATNNNGTPTSEFGVRADKFWVCSPGVPTRIPFVVFNGITYMDVAMIRDATITSAKIQSLAADKIVATNLAAISANMGTITAGQLNFGSYTGYSWPAAGLNGAHMSASGILLGNANNGQYFQLTNTGVLYAPGLVISGGNATFSGNLAANTVTTNAINGHAITEYQNYVNGGSVPVGLMESYKTLIAQVTVYAEAGGIVEVFFTGTPNYSGGSQYAYAHLQLTRNGAEIGREYVSNTKGGVLFLDAAPTGSHVYNLYAWHTTLSGTMTMVNYKMAVKSIKR